MAEYTPTTRDVRDDYARYGGELDAFPEFDRWLTEHDRQVAEKAWTEGARATTRDNFEVAWTEMIVIPRNPYRKGNW